MRNTGNHMDSLDFVDEINALLELDVGDPYGLEHIKQHLFKIKKSGLLMKII